MPTCIEYMRQRLETNGYRVHHQAIHDLIVAEQSAYTAEQQQVWVFHAEAPLEPEDIRRCFDFKGHLMFIVDEKLIPDDVADKTACPMWLRVLHGLFLGRVYVWNGRGVYGVHFDWDTGDVSESGYIPVEDLRCQESGSWVKGWPGVYKLAFLHDRAWWMGGAPRHEYTYNHDGGKANYGTADGWSQDQRTGWWKYEPKTPPPAPKQQPKPADYYSQFLACRNATEAKALWKRLLVQHHPDKFSDADAIERQTKITQEINQAYQKAEKVL